jgi:ribonuclease-3
MKNLEPLFEKLGHHFQNPALLIQALSHRSLSRTNNERLEFLGDAVIGFIMASEVYEQQPEAKEGELSRLRSSLVNGDALALIAKNLEIDQYLLLGGGEIRSGGKERGSILADALEAVVGAIYLDAGIDACRRCVLGWYDAKTDLSALVSEKDAKSKLQEWAQSQKLPLPAYHIETTGEAHAQTFTATCSIQGSNYTASGTSNSRKRAEQAAAEEFLTLLGKL